MEIVGLGWLGTRTGQSAALADFYTQVLRLRLSYREPGFWVFGLPDGHNVEVFGLDYPGKSHFNTGPVAGFAVDDLQTAVAELSAAGVELLGEARTDVAAVSRPGRQRVRTPRRLANRAWRPCPSAAGGGSG